MNLLKNPTAKHYMGIMGAKLIIGIPLLYDINKGRKGKLGINFSKVTQRKLFHLFAYVLFMPIHSQMLNKTVLFKLLVLT